jgi:hypothetical protein
MFSELFRKPENENACFLASVPTEPWVKVILKSVIYTFKLGILEYLKHHNSKPVHYKVLPAENAPYLSYSMYRRFSLCTSVFL